MRGLDIQLCITDGDVVLAGRVEDLLQGISLGGNKVAAEHTEESGNIFLHTTFGFYLVETFQ